MLACGHAHNLLIKNSYAPLEVASQCLDVAVSFDVVFISAIVYFKKYKKARSLAGIVMKCQGWLQ